MTISAAHKYENDRGQFAGSDDGHESTPAAVLAVNPAGLVLSANELARRLFGTIDPRGIGLRTLFGLIGASNSSGLASAIAQPDPSRSVRVLLADGQSLDAYVGARLGGGATILLLDVSRYARDGERASKDLLTGLDNRESFVERTNAALVQAASASEPLAVLCLDLDRFKQVNDTLGHATGDALLGKVAERLRAAVRSGDIVGRLGGDEFAIVQVGSVQPSASQELAKRLVDLVSRTYVVNGHVVNIGVSVGIASAPADGDTTDVLMKRADLALYAAKEAGRGQFRLFDPVMDERMRNRRMLELNLRKALAFKEFELAYQPQMHLETDTISGFEALIRWRSPVHGVVSPGVFIPLAEEIGLMDTIGEWVLNTACKQAATWPSAISVAVNLSPVQFRSGRLVQTVTSALARSTLDPHRLELEITEGALLEDTEYVLTTLRALRAMGVRISMDDFGTGYASLSYLQKFPFDKIKIDQSFVRGMDENVHCGAIVRAVASLGASTGMKTTAEGVETHEQLLRIRAEGCTEVQGYLTGRPLSADDASALIVSQPLLSPAKESTHDR